MKNRSRLLLAALVATMPVAGACGGGDGDQGQGGATEEPDRTIEVEMVDIAYRPNEFSVGAGETVRFVFTNIGQLTHEAVIGDQEVQMTNRTAQHNRHDDDTKITLETGKQGELTYTFEEAGTIGIGCHLPGHYDAGMRAVIEVA